MTRLPLLFLLALPLVSACAQDNAKNLETVRPQLQTQSSVEGANPEVAQRSQALTAAEAGLVDRGANARPLASLEEKGAPAGTDELLNLIRAHHAEPAAIETRLAALEDPAASLLAIEANAEQTSHALPTAGVHFHVAPAEDTGVKDGCADLVTVAQALHRLDRPAFFDEAARILRPGGLLAVWRYGKMAIHPPIDVILERYYEDVLAPYWEDDLDAIEAAYTTGDLPFEALPAPDFPMRTKWTLDEVLGYLETWSASRAFRAANGHFATDTIRPAIAELWGEETRREIDWPLRVAVRRKPA